MSASCGNSLWFSGKRNKYKYRKLKLKKKRHANLSVSIPQRSLSQFKREMIESAGIFTRQDVLNFGSIKGHLRSS